MKAIVMVLVVATVVGSGCARPEWMTSSSPDPAIYYVSSSGDDANDGSTTKPWRTINKVNATTLSPGDTVALEGGAQFHGHLLISQSGTSNLPIQITSYSSASGDRAEISAGAGDGITLRDSEHIRLSNLKITGAGINANNGHGITLRRTMSGSQRLNSIYLDHVEISGFRMTGIAIYADATVSVGYNDVRITHSDVYGNGYAGMWMDGCAHRDFPGVYCMKNIYVGYTRIHDNPGIDINEQTGNGIFFKDVDGGTIEHCLAYNNGALNRNDGGGPVGIWALFSNNVTIQFNESYGNRTRANDGDGFDFDGGMTNSTMQYNYAHDNDGAGFLLWDFHEVMQSSNNVVRYNISENDGRKGFFGGIHLGTSGAGRMTNVHIYGNTVYSGVGTDAAFGIRGHLYGIGVYNNIFMTASGTRLVHSLGGEDGVLMQGNAYWDASLSFQFLWKSGSHRGLSSWRAASGQERMNGVAVGFQVNPRLLAPGRGGTIGNTDKLHTLTAYQLTPTSPLRDQGLNLPALLGIFPGHRDFFGNAIPQGPGFDIGASEVPSPQ